MPKIFSHNQSDEELEYINRHFKNIANRNDIDENNLAKNIEENKKCKYKPITITKKERLVLIQSIRYNNNFVMPFVADKKTINSLKKKGFIEKIEGKNNKHGLFSVKKNVCLLFQIEGDMAFDEILK